MVGGFDLEKELILKLSPSQMSRTATNNKQTLTLYKNLKGQNLSGCSCLQVKVLSDAVEGWVHIEGPTGARGVIPANFLIGGGGLAQGVELPFDAFGSTSPFATSSPFGASPLGASPAASPRGPFKGRIRRTSLGF